MIDYLEFNRLSREEFNELKAKENLEKSLDFFYSNGCLPSYNENDKQEMKLYDFLRKTDFSLYNIDNGLLNDLKNAQKSSKKRKMLIKKQKHIKRKRIRISNSIKNYYNFYLQNGKFPTDSKSSNTEEKSISKAYTSILKLNKYYTQEQRHMIKMIQQIKNNIENRKKLKIIKQYVNFYEKYGVLPVRKKNLSSIKSVFERKSHDLAVKMNVINLNEVKIPLVLQKKLNSIDNIKNNELRFLIQTTNEYMEILLYFVDEQNSKIYHGKLIDEMVIYNDNEIKLSSVINFVCENREFVENGLIEKYSNYLKKITFS